MRIRNPNNTNLYLHQGIEWNGLPLSSSQAPYTYIENYLEKISAVIDRASNVHPRLAVFRFDLRFPDTHELDLDNPGHHFRDDSRVISRFLESLHSQIQYDLKRKQQRGGQRIHPTSMHYIWAKEQNKSIRPHYHLAVLLNNDTYHKFGNYHSLKPDNDNMASRVCKAFASALGVDYEVAAPCVEFCKVLYINTNADDYLQQRNDAFKAVSYLAKESTKPYGDGSNWFGSSRT